MSETKVICTLRKGSRMTYWQPNGILEGIIEVNPDYPPRLHYLDGRPPVEFVPVQVPVMVAPRHEHMPVIVGQEYPRDISPIVDRTERRVEWALPEDPRWSDAEIEIMKARGASPLSINRIK